MQKQFEKHELQAAKISASKTKLLFLSLLPYICLYFYSAEHIKIHPTPPTSKGYFYLASKIKLIPTEAKF